MKTFKQNFLFLKIEHGVIMDEGVSTADPGTGCASGRLILRTSCTTHPSPHPVCRHPVSPKSISLQQRFLSIALTIRHFDIELYSTCTQFD